MTKAPGDSSERFTRVGHHPVDVGMFERDATGDEPVGGVCGEGPVETAVPAKTGQEIWGSQRIKSGTYSASPVLADGKVYVTNEDGLTTVLKAGPKFEILAENPLDDHCLSSPAISDGQIFIRTAQHLHCIGKRSSES